MIMYRLRKWRWTKTANFWRCGCRRRPIWGVPVDFQHHGAQLSVRFLLAGQYSTPLIYSEVKAVFTNTAPVDACRGAGRPEATYLVERLVDICAADMGLDPAEIRRRNFIPVDAFPYQTPVVQCYDSGDYPAALDKAMELADYSGFSARAEEAKSRGKLRGIGLSSYVEACGIAPSAAVGQLGAGVGLWESAQVRFNPTGNVQVLPAHTPWTGS